VDFLDNGGQYGAACAGTTMFGFPPSHDQLSFACNLKHARTLLSPSQLSTD